MVRRLTYLANPIQSIKSSDKTLPVESDVSFFNFFFFTWTLRCVLENYPYLYVCKHTAYAYIHRRLILYNIWSPTPISQNGIPAVSPIPRVRPLSFPLFPFPPARPTKTGRLARTPLKKFHAPKSPSSGKQNCRCLNFSVLLIRSRCFTLFSFILFSFLFLFYYPESGKSNQKEKKGTK